MRGCLRPALEGNSCTLVCASHCEGDSYTPYMLKYSTCPHPPTLLGFTICHPWRLGYRAATTRLPVASLQLACCPHTTCPLPACSVAPTCLPTAHNFMVNCPAGGFVPGHWININIASFAIVASGPTTCCEPWRRRLCLSIHWPCGDFATFLLL